MRFILSLFLVLPFLGKAQNLYPQDYFRSPLDIPLILAGTFAELRSNHFHSGIDIKTQQRSGLNVLASADGYVSRIKISHFGYGKALYLTHPNGYTTVYAHLQKFSPEIEQYIKQIQYQKESYEVEVFPSAEKLPVTKGQLIAYSGNTGGSGGPHLHYEIRDKQERPMNPMLFGINIKDTTTPLVKSVYAYPIGDHSFVNKSNKKYRLQLKPVASGDYYAETIDAIGTLGFGIETIDRQDLAANSNGVYNIQTFINGSKNFELDFKKFGFDETKHINQLIDYEHYTKEKKRIQKLYKQNIPLSIIKEPLNDGYIHIEDSTNAVYKIKVADFNNNASWVTVHINGKYDSAAVAGSKKTTPYFVKANQHTHLKTGRISVDFYKDTFYEDFYIDFQVNQDTVILHEDVMAAKKNFSIHFDVSHYNNDDINKLYIARLVGYKKTPYYTYTKRKNNTLTARTKTLGTYTITSDYNKPIITPINFKNGQWLSKYRYLKITIDDKESGISNYRATLNGKWILMEYDYKTKTLTHDFNDNVLTETKNNLKVIVTDNVGNSSTFESVFYRK
ncbi:M23 family metallopeptidase [Tamlana fucoidanivorans]|uniref:M23 family metallopeptidase n=1 Tax=Allotamlana fucoidanivorans TaxID=2583814 RepID=A0A5C4SHB4_9FLAO|nr:M23 family metallopeptidase [Tamlana fucoidanivorans]TNJ42167.1 M23 family metallopeptidase [Tamlana fucoidanivorans]